MLFIQPLLIHNYCDMLVMHNKKDGLYDSKK